MRGQDYDTARNIIEEVCLYEFTRFMDKTFIRNFLWDSVRESERNIHCFFSPSKSSGWFHCPAYLDRATQWTGSSEPALRGTMCHAVMEHLILAMLGDKTLQQNELDSLITLIREPNALSRVGLQSVEAGMNVVAKLMNDGAKVTPEAFLTARDCGWEEIEGYPEQGKYLGGSVDILAANPKTKTLYIYDLKTGKNAVSPDTPQLKCYAVLAVLNKAPCAISKDWNVTVGILQNGTVLEDTMTAYQLSDFGDKLVEQMKIYKEYSAMSAMGERDLESKLPEAFKPNKCCRFCSGCTFGGM